MILVTGCARSGTTLTTSVLQVCGAKLGDVNRLKEHRFVRDHILKDYLRNRGFDPMGQYPLPTYDDLDIPPDLGNEVRRLLGPANAYKGAKLSFLWPLFHTIFPDALWVIVRRSKKGMIQSCQRTNFMRNRQTWEPWVDYQLECLEDLKKVSNYIEVWPEVCVHDPNRFKPMIDFCGLEWKPDETARLIDNDKMRT